MTTLYDRPAFRVGHRFPITVDEIGRLEVLRRQLDSAAHELDVALRTQNITALRRALRYAAAAAALTEEFKATFAASPTAEVATR